MIVWQHPQDPPSLEGDRVHLWRANLNVPAVAVDRLASFLSADEIARANKFRFEIHKNRFIASRGILREILGNYLNINPEKIKFDYGDRGKPQLARFNTDNSKSLQFNVSHSQDYALYGFTICSPIGVDLEYLRAMPDAVKIARRFFSPQESQLIASLDNEQQQRVFFKLWTAKEAYLKAVGMGLAGSLASVDVSLDETETASLSSIDGNVAAAANWFMYSFIPAANYVATIVVKNQLTEQQVDVWSWNKNC